MPGPINSSITHYVKFVRGSTSAWESLQKTPNKIDNDTLYFIYDSIENVKEGKLYLGQKLISGSGEGSSGVVNINDIGDIYIDDSTLADKQILVYNETSQQWENAPLSTIINGAIGVMQGATENAAGTSGLVPVPPKGAQAHFLRGDGTWAAINIPTFNSKVFTLDSNNQIQLQGYEDAAIGSVFTKTKNGIKWADAPVGTLNRQITTLEKLQAQLDGTDPDPIDTNTIYMVLKNNGGSTDNKYDEYMVIDGALELLGTFGEVNLTNYITKTEFNTAISNLNNILQDKEDEETGELIPGLISRVTTIENNYITQAQIGDLNNLTLSEGNTTLVEEVNTINEKLKWHSLDEE